MPQPVTQEFDLEPADNERLANLCGQLDEHLRQIERRLDVQISNRGNHFRVVGDSKAASAGRDVLCDLFSRTEKENVTPQDVHMSLQQLGMDGNGENDEQLLIKTRRTLIRVRGGNQQGYVNSIRKNDLTFGIGPAGTGKTYLAVGCAVDALERESVRRIVLVRPAVEAGERLGFLPGDLSQKVDPYLRPIYDALYEMLGFDRVARLIDRNVIEVAPLAYMRGRTLNESFVILDEAQNTTIEQMKMFLTRIGFGAKAVVTGDITQTDLPDHRESGLRHAMKVLRDVKGIHFTQFNARDVVRHPLVRRIVDAYASHDKDSKGG
ncbi:MAG: PhoH family protein [Gammaproteobacteria bacterium]|nr:PhoH family protein [Gammaproteobacteria bacterium]NNM19887.1 PhoH family protein [Gammaproteobacteria bacterium]